jgi:hypothetical protein
MITPDSPPPDRLDAWYDGSAICVVAVSGTGDPLDLSDDEVAALVAKLKRCLDESQAPHPEASQSPASRALQDSWAVTLRHLAASRYYLPEELTTADALEAERNMVHYLHHNELGLALYEAEALGAEVAAPRPYWRELQLAALNMNLLAHAARLAQRNDA